MRPVRLARIAAQAEVVRLRGMAVRIATHVVLGIVALVFLLGTLVFAHIAAWYGIRIGGGMSFVATAGILGGADLLIAVILGFLASRTSPSKTEVEAYDVRQRAIAGIGSALSLTAMILPVLRLATNFRRRRK